MANRKMTFLDVGLTSQFISVVFLLKNKTTFVKYYLLWAVIGQSIPFAYRSGSLVMESPEL